MKKLFTLLAFLTVFMGAKAIEIVDAEVDFSKVTEIPRFSWGGSESAFARLSLQNGCLHFHNEEAVDPSWDVQFFPIGGVSAEVGVTYTLHFKVKGTVDKGVSMLGFGQTPYGQFQITTDWVEGTIDYECTEANGNMLMQCGDYVGDWDIAYLKITHEGKAERPIQWKDMLTNGDAEKSWEELGLGDVAFDDSENNYKICLWTKEKGVNENNAHPAEITDENGNKVFICRATLADTEEIDEWGNAKSAWDNQIWFESPRAWKSGEQFKITFRYKASRPVKTDTQVHKQTPGDYAGGAVIDGSLNWTTEWQTYEKVANVSTDGMWSVCLNCNNEIKDPMDFYIDDITWSEIVVDHGMFAASTNTVSGLVDYDYDTAVEFVNDVEMSQAILESDEGIMSATVGTVGKQESWVNEVMISTVRGNDRMFKANTIKVKGAVTVDDWLDYEEGSSAKIKLPAQGVWTIYLYTEDNKISFTQLEGDAVVDPLDPAECINETEVIVNAVERDKTLAEKQADGEAPTEFESDEAKNAADAECGHPWDNQFFLIGNEPLNVGDEVYIRFEYMAETPAQVGTQNSKDAGGYLHWAGLGNLDFTEEWQVCEKTVTIPGETAANGPQNSWTFNMANMKGANTYHLKNFIFMSADHTKNYINKEGTANFWVKEGANTAAFEFGNKPDPDGIKNVSNNKVAPSVTFNLAGQRVAKDYKGIVIENGVKVIK